MKINAAKHEQISSSCIFSKYSDHEDAAHPSGCETLVRRTGNILDGLMRYGIICNSDVFSRECLLYAGVGLAWAEESA